MPFYLTNQYLCTVRHRRREVPAWPQGPGQTDRPPVYQTSRPVNAVKYIINMYTVYRYIGESEREREREREGGGKKVGERESKRGRERKIDR